MAVVSILKSAWWKGHLGELVARAVAWLTLDTGTYHRLHNITLPTPDGTTQIDHLFVSRFGIFVLETKNMKGWIFGTENQAQWTQKIYAQSFKFQNPLRQNFKHAKAVEAALGISADTIHSVVAFVGGSTFKTEMPRNVTKGAGFVSYIRSFRVPVFTELQVNGLLEDLQSKRLKPNSSTHRRHVGRLRDRSKLDAARLCPRCGSPLVLRTARSGSRAGQQFWGCSTFPKCRVVQNVT
jgi:hypothetical protein